MLFNDFLRLDKKELEYYINSHHPETWKDKLLHEFSGIRTYEVVGKILEIENIRVTRVSYGSLIIVKKGFTPISDMALNIRANVIHFIGQTRSRRFVEFGKILIEDNKFAGIIGYGMNTRGWPVSERTHDTLKDCINEFSRSQWGFETIN